MLTLRWTTTGSGLSVAEPTILAGRLPFRSTWQFLHAVWWARRIRHELANAGGLAGHSLALDIRGRCVWTVSAWRSRTSLNRFDHSPLHQRAKTALRPGMLPSTFVMWTATAGENPVSWDEIRARIAGSAQPAD